MIQDFKFAFRQLLKSPGFTSVAVLTLALAIGVNSAIFALINSVVLHPMVPMRPQEVVNVFNCRQNANHDYRQFSYNEYRELRENGENLFVDLAALEFAVAHSVSGAILPSHLPEAIGRGEGADTEDDAFASSELNLARLERQAILRALQTSGFDKAKSARLLGIGKTTMYRKLKEMSGKPRGERVS